MRDDIICLTLAAGSLGKALAAHNGYLREFAEEASEKSGKSFRSLYLTLAAFQWLEFFCVLPATVHHITGCMVSWHRSVFGSIGWLAFVLLLHLELRFRKKYNNYEHKDDPK